MPTDVPDPAGGSPRLGPLVTGGTPQAMAVLAASVAAWGFLTWIAVDMGHPLVQLTMPGTPDWSMATTMAVFVMWAVMMAAMMLPSAVPMILAFVHISARSGEPSRARVFVAAYLLVWAGFSAAATAVQWVLQAVDWVDPMIVSTSPLLNGALLLIAGIYQFTPLKAACLSHCRTPIGFLMGEWRPGIAGSFRMGVRHGLFCAGCCWAVMALLFVGGVMNLAWIAALSIVVAIEKMAPGGERLARSLGIVLIVAGAVKLAASIAQG